MIFDRLLVSGRLREEVVYYQGILQRRIGKDVFTESELRAALDSRHDLVSLGNTLLGHRLTVKTRPVETFYTGEDDPC